MRVDCQSSATEDRAQPAMKSDQIIDLVNNSDVPDIISTDVFDTLLLRNFRSERSRIMRGEKIFSRWLVRHGWNVPADLLMDVRLRSQRMAFRGLALRSISGEVRLVDIVGRQLLLLGLPETLLAERLAIELQVEKESLFANQPLAAVLRARRSAGARIIAVSDTTLPTNALRELIQHFHGKELIDCVYSSADQGLTKRDGELFLAVARAENIALSKITHFGDDLHADVRVPSAKGITVCHTPRPAYRRYLRSINGALSEAERHARGILRAMKAPTTPSHDAKAFGRAVFGPIVVQFCLLIWLYVVEAKTGHKACLLFCARGGIGIREAFELTLARLGLPLDVRRENIMISRLVAARAALLARSSSAVEELEREFSGSNFADVAAALGGRKYELSDDWQQPFRAQHFLTLLFGDTGTAVRSDIEQQNAFFTRHFKQLVGDSDRVILCDTGLYGSTQRLLASAFPDLRIETIQFARSNYKRHSEEHFTKVTGLLVEQNFYSPLNIHSCVLRYWHLIESLFEPAVSSVRLFAEDQQGQVVGNCGDISFGAFDPAEKNPLLAGAVSYIAALPNNGGARALVDSEVAWHRLNSAITRPTAAELRCLEVGGRSVDFGRSDVLQVFADRKKETFIRRLISIRVELWREGAITRQFPLLKYALLPLLTAALSLRGLLGRQD